MFGSLDEMLEQRSLTRAQWQQLGRVPDWTNAIDAHFATMDGAGPHLFDFN
jgi:hypothetical protein